MTLTDRIQVPRPKKILALDGGGIRGMMTIEVLAEIENQLRHQLKKGAEFRLAHFFDFVAGTSTGAIIAACVSSGMLCQRFVNFMRAVGRRCSIRPSCSSAFVINMRMRSLREAPSGVRQGHDVGERQAPDCADDGDAECHDGFALAGLEQSLCKV